MKCLKKVTMCSVQLKLSTFDTVKGVVRVIFVVINNSVLHPGMDTKQNVAVKEFNLTTCLSLDKMTASSFVNRSGISTGLVLQPESHKEQDF